MARGYSPSDRKLFIEKIERRRRDLGESEKAACEKVGLNLSTYRRWKRKQADAGAAKEPEEGGVVVANGKPDLAFLDFRKDTTTTTGPPGECTLPEDPAEMRALVDRLRSERALYRHLLTEILLGRASVTTTFERILDVAIGQDPGRH